MKEIVDKKEKYHILYLLLIMVTYIFVSNICAVNDIILPIRIMQYITTVVLCAFIGIFGVIFLWKKYNSKLVANIVCMSILIFFTTVIGYEKFEYGFLSVANIIASSLFWSFAFLAAYYIGFENPKAINKSLVITCMLPVFFVLFLQVKDKIILIKDMYEYSSAVYYLLCLLPFVFLLKVRAYRMTCIAIIIAAVLISSKRTAIIVLALVMVAYYFVSMMMKGVRLKGKFKYIFLVAILCVLMGHIISKYNITIFDKLNNMFDDEGSGRLDIYVYTWEMIKNMDTMSLIFGRGFNMVYFDLGIGLSAHTDFLEVIYDYGILGFILYIRLYIIILGYFSRLYKEKSEYAPALMSAIVIMFGMSVTSHLIIYNTYFIYMCIFFGLVTGRCDKLKLIKENVDGNGECDNSDIQS